MILYHVDSQYQLLCATIHRMQTMEEADITLHEGVLGRFEKWQRLRIGKIFRNMIIVDPFFRYKTTKERADAYYREKLHIRDYTNIYVWGAHRSFGYFLMENEIPFDVN